MNTLNYKMSLKKILDSAEYKNIIIKANYDQAISNGIVFIYPSWSIDQKYFKIILDCLKAKSISDVLYVLDIDDNSCRTFETKFNVLNQGKGETYLIKNNKIIASINEHNNKDVKERIEKLLELCE
jgi:hypothetical protein